MHWMKMCQNNFKSLLKIMSFGGGGAICGTGLRMLFVSFLLRSVICLEKTVNQNWQRKVASSQHLAAWDLYRFNIINLATCIEWKCVKMTSYVYSKPCHFGGGGDFERDFECFSFRSCWEAKFSWKKTVNQNWQRTLRSCFMSSFVEFHLAVSEKKLKMSQEIIGKGGHLGFPIDPIKHKLWRGR